MEKIKLELYNTWRTQIEVLPRLSILYGKGYQEDNYELTMNGVGFDWLWFGIFVGW